MTILVLPFDAFMPNLILQQLWGSARAALWSVVAGAAQLTSIIKGCPGSAALP